MTELAVGIDIGTTRVKAGVVDAERNLLHVAAHNTPWHKTDTGPVVDVAELGDTALDVAARCGEWATSRGHRVVAIGVTGMAETGALLDADGTALAPGFAWHHPLGDAEGVQRTLGWENFAATTGHGCDLAPSIVKLDYLRSRGHRFEPGQRWLNIPEYVTWRLTDVMASEFSLSGRTGLFDLIGRDWWEEGLEFIGAGRWLMPGDPVAAGTAVGRVPDTVPPLSGAVVTTAGHDHPVAAVGLGLEEPGALALSLGTSEAHVRVVEPTLTRDEVLALVGLGTTVDWHPLADRWYVLGTLPTNLTLERLSRILGCSSTEERLSLSERALSTTSVGSARLADVGLDGFSLVGVTDADTPESVWRMSVEQLVRRSSDFIAEVSKITGDPREEVMLGGWTFDPLVRQVRAEKGQRLLETTPSEPGIVGATVFAFHAVDDKG